MNRTAGVIAGIVALTLAAGAGYWWGGRSQTVKPMAEAKLERKLLYYRNPMGLPDTSPVPKKDPMGMDYVPVYEGEAEAAPAAAGRVVIGAEKVQKLGVRTEPAAVRELDRVVRAAGRIEIDERRVHAVSPKFEGWVEKLYVNATGQPVAKGQPLFDVYSPELVSAQREYAIAAQGVASLREASPEAQASMRQLAESSLMRLRNWDIPEAQIQALAKSGDVRRTLTLRAPVSGIVLEKKALAGMRFMPGESLYQIADLSSVWVVADVFEQDIAQVAPGAPATITLSAFPGETFSGKVSYVYPTLNEQTRTVPVRVDLANPGLRLKPAMYAQMELAAKDGRALAVPLSAVIDSGTRRIVLVQAGAGRFEPREVSLGQRGDNYVEVLEGVREGEPVVVAANFLIDAESNLKAALGSLSPAATGAGPKAQAKAVGHRGEGTVESVDLKTGAITLNHGPIASLKWPAMSMEFTLANASLAQKLKPGDRVAFEFVERQPGDYVVTQITRPPGH
ncbi:MAG: efflux RND transporter periplasmic adaptor subunit [Pseudomonadota bacterium]